MNNDNANIKAGDIVKVINWGRIYSIRDNWLLDRLNLLKLEWLARYAYGDSKNFTTYFKRGSDWRRWKVLFVDVDDNLALITQQFDGNGAVYLIGLDGLSPLTREMTLSEIEAELGYPVKIV